MRSLEGKLAIVTGASRGRLLRRAAWKMRLKYHQGIGAAIARVLASKGANTVIGFTSASSANLAAAFAAELQTSFQIKAVPVRADLTITSGPLLLIEEAKRAFSNPVTGAFVIDIIINNAGLGWMGAVGSISLEDDILPMYSLNVFAPLLLLQAALPFLPLDRSGRIVNISSTSSSNGCADQSVYGATKAALEAMTRTWSRELCERATVNAINPGPVLTEMFGNTSSAFRAGLKPMVDLVPLMKLRPEVDGEQMARDWASMGDRLILGKLPV
ncbi:MAG: hypothetical protein M1821_002688 [Bathelium mastoideum]|nr:MAG: hypothetical protein M1821_002688 [Bathelium mastoideum]